MSDDHASFRRRRSDELYRFAAALRKSSLQCDVSSLDRAGSKCRGAAPEGKGSWGYKLDGLLFQEPDDAKHIRPKGASFKAVEINIDLTGKCAEEGAQNGDPLLHLGVEVILVGEVKKENSKVSLRSAWYMDRYDSVGDRITAGKNVKCPVHPCYHVQFGGKHIKAVDPGEMIVVNPPRLAHPPMDAILAVDFVLSNYFSSQWLELREDSEYFPLVRKAQQRFWLPYAQALMRNWGRPTREGIWEVSDLWPQIQH